MAERPQLTDERKALLIAALFHDIGKFHYRAEKSPGTHAEKGGEFVKNHLGRFRALRPVLDRIEALVRTHHSPDADHRIQAADHLSAAERQDEDVAQGRRPLESIFARIDVGAGSPPDGTFYLEPGAIGESNLFPKNGETPGEDEVIEWHRGAWEGFLGDLARVPEDLEFSGLVWTLHALLEKWCTRVSSAAYRSVPDIALFDHLRVSAAYADCFLLAEDDDKPLLLVKGDLGGIQRFIYRLRTPEGEQKGSAKQLRGRSFYVRLVNETLARWVLDELGLFRPNLILSGGGHFLIVAPNRAESESALRELRRRANEWLLRAFHLDLSLVLEWVACSGEEMEDFPPVMDALEAKVWAAKRRRASDLLGGPGLFGPFETETAELEACPVCQALVTDRKQHGGKCSLCDLHQKLGAAIPNTDYLVEVVGIGQGTPREDVGRALVHFPEMGRAWYLVSRQRLEGTTELEMVVGAFSENTQLRVTTLGSSEFLSEDTLRIARLGGPRVQALDFAFQANYLPRDGEGNVMSFQEIAEAGPAFPYLGFFRADVDDLGFVFSRGFRGSGTEADEKDNRSLSRFAALSRELDLFFSHHVDALAREHHLYVTYSGGDDLFVIGHWLNVVEFARKLYEDFAKATCGNPNLGISGGIAVGRPDYPVRLAAQEAAESQEAAKSRPGANGDPGKRSFCLFDSVHPWPRALELLDYAEQIKTLVEEERELRALVRTVLELSRKAIGRAGIDAGAFPALRAYLHYALARRAGVTSSRLTEGNGEPKVELFAKLISQPDLFEDFEVVGSYVLLATRERKR